MKRLERLPPVIEAMLYADGTIGLLTMEGADRNPNCLDLMAEAYAMIGAHARLRPLDFRPRKRQPSTDRRRLRVAHHGDFRRTDFHDGGSHGGGDSGAPSPT